jgi:1-acyl-sn-glycerol-3-phosphate acyltransferase
MQWLTTWVSITLNKIFLSPKVVGLEHLDCMLCAKEHEQTSIVFVANHLSEIDPFVITAFLKARHKKIIFPITFLAKKELHDHWFKNWFMSLLGCVPVGLASRNDIFAIKKFFDNRETVFLFPEGEMTRTGEYGTDQKGVRAFCRFSKVIVVPVRIEGLKMFGDDWPNLVLRRRKLKIVFGHPVVLPKSKEEGFDAVEHIKALDVPEQLTLECLPSRCSYAD